MDVTLRWCTPEDWPAVALADGRAFAFHYEQQDLDDRAPTTDMTRFLVAEDDGSIVGVTGDYPFAMTVPGGGQVDVGGVTWVSVQTSHRRRGVLRAMMAEQHRRFVELGLPAGILTASQGGIYGRFGYAPATRLRKLEIDRRLTQVRADTPTSGSVRLVEKDEARSLMPDLHERWRRQTPGAISRSAAWWDFLMLDREERRGGASKLFFAMHADGFVSYRVEHRWNDGHPAHLVDVKDQCWATPEAHADLWRFLLSLDLIGQVRTWRCPPGDAIEFLVDDPREARTVKVDDGLWLRLLDVPKMLQARTYGADGRLVLDVHDPFLDLGARVRLVAEAGAGEVGATDASPDLVLGVAALGAAYLGAHKPTTLARAGLIEECSPGALQRADALFAADRPADYGTHF
jgi:predicted acetyltransferase